MRFALAGFNHETNTFHSIPTEYENFEKSMMLRGEEITKLYETPSSVGGFYQASRDLDFEIVPLMFAQTGPLGTITSDAFERILGEILDLIENNGPFDAILLDLHGAAGAALQTYAGVDLQAPLSGLTSIQPCRFYVGESDSILTRV